MTFSIDKPGWLRKSILQVLADSSVPSLLTREVHERRCKLTGHDPKKGGTGATVAMLTHLVDEGKVQRSKRWNGASSWSIQ